VHRLGQSARSVSETGRSAGRYMYTRSAMRISTSRLCALATCLAALVASGDCVDWECSDEGGCWPQNWLLGAQKAGSTSAAEMLFQPPFSMCGAEKIGVNEGKPTYYHKETHFFDRNRMVNRPMIDKHEKSVSSSQRDDRMEYFNFAPENFTALYPAAKRGDCPHGMLEATPSNIRSAFESHLPSLLKAWMPSTLIPHLRFMVVVREPISRGLSLYNHHAYLEITETTLHTHPGIDRQTGGWFDPCFRKEWGGFEAYSRCHLRLARMFAKEKNMSDQLPVDVHEWENVTAILDLGLGRLPFESSSGTLWTGIYEPQIQSFLTTFSRKQMFIIEVSRT